MSSRYDNSRVKGMLHMTRGRKIVNGDGRRDHPAGLGRGELDQSRGVHGGHWRKIHGKLHESGTGAAGTVSVRAHHDDGDSGDLPAHEIPPGNSGPGGTRPIWRRRTFGKWPGWATIPFGCP